MNETLLKKVIEGYDKFEYEPILESFVNEDLCRCCPVTVLYCLKNGVKPEEADEDKIIKWADKNPYLAGIVQGFDCTPILFVGHQEKTFNKGYEDGRFLYEMLSSKFDCIHSPNFYYHQQDEDDSDWCLDPDAFDPQLTDYEDD